MHKIDINKISMTQITRLFLVILFFLFVILLFAWIFMHNSMRIEVEMLKLVETLLLSLVGVIFPFFIFNVFYEYLMRTYTSQQISEKISDTIMSKKELIDSFSSDRKRVFIKNTLQSILKEEKGSVVYDMISPYLKSELLIRKEYKYTIILEEMESVATDSWGGCLSMHKYDVITENLTYSKWYPDGFDFPKKLKIGFAANQKVLDEYFHQDDKEHYIFRENLFIDSEDMAEVVKNKNKFVNECMNLKLFMKLDKNNDEYNAKPLAIEKIDANEFGIVVTYDITHFFKDNSDNSAIIYNISFSMPQLKSREFFQIIVIEPTFCPRIRFIYPDKVYEITTISFFTENQENSCSSINIGGMTEIELKGWVLPKSGLVVLWRRRDSICSKV